MQNIYCLYWNTIHKSMVVECAVCASACYMRGALVANRSTHIYMHLLAAEPYSTAGLLCLPCVPVEQSCWPCIRWCGTGRFQEQSQCLFYWPKLLHPFLSSTIFPFLFFLSIGWYCGAGVFGLIGCRSLSPNLALPTSFNNNYNYYY